MSAGLPHNWENERIVLGGLMADPSQYATIADVLTVEDFARPQHGALFRLMGELVERASSCDLATVLGLLDDGGNLEAYGGTAYVVALPGACTSVELVEPHARRVRSLADQRRLILALAQSTEAAVVARADADPEIAGRLADEAMARIQAVRDRASVAQPWATPAADVDDLMRDAEEAARSPGKLRGLPTGVGDLDRLLLGLQGGKLYVVAARPAMGKSALAEGWALAAAKAGHAVGFFSLEMPRRELTHRGACMVGMVNGRRIESGEGTNDEMVRYARALAEVAELPLYVDDTAGISIGDLRARARAMVRAHGIRLVVVDYLQLVHGLSRKDGREREIADITAALKGLAKDLALPVVVLSQLNRSLESRSDKHPMMSDLRESGAIEQDADVIVFVYRDEVYNPESADKGLAELVIAKHRGGPTGMVKAAFLGQFTLFRDLAAGGGYA